MSRQNILVVDGDVDTRTVVRQVLEREGFGVSEAEDGTAALDQIAARVPDLIVLDVNLPSVGGFDILARLRSTHAVPVIMVTGRDSETDRVLGLELGADDYVVKPFSPRELASRIRAVLRRTSGSTQADILRYGPLCIDLASREVSLDGAPLGLTTREYDLLAFLAASPRRVFSRAQLLERVWASGPGLQDPATVTEHIRRVRAKLATGAQSPRIRTVRGVGYAFEP
jgi:DNA-binding response OmpR family regulator